jgi:hypothetical protein
MGIQDEFFFDVVLSGMMSMGTRGRISGRLRPDAIA